MASITALPIEVIRDIALSLDQTSLSRLSKVCKSLNTLCEPLLWRKIHLKEPRSTLLHVAYKIFTQPRLAREVRTIITPALAKAPPIQAEQPTEASGKKAESEHQRGWPGTPEAESVLREQVSTALDGETPDSIDAALTAVRDGTREDLVLMLILMNTPKLEVLDIGAMGPRNDNSLTRAMFRNAAQGLTRLTSVAFGRTPEPIVIMDEPDSKDYELRPDLTFSYSLFVDLFRLPAIHELEAFSVAPCNSWDVEDELDTYFDYIYELDKNNTTLKLLWVTEQLGLPTSHLDHVLRHCTAIEYLSFISTFESNTDGSGWGANFEHGSFQELLLSCPDSLRSLELSDCLYHDDPLTFVDDRSKITLQSLKNLEFVRLDVRWLFDREDIGLGNRPYELERNRERLISLLPESIRKICLYNGGDDWKLDESVNAAIRALVQHYVAKNGFPYFEALQVLWIRPDMLEMWEATFEMARDAGLSVSVHDRFFWEKYWW